MFFVATQFVVTTFIERVFPVVDGVPSSALPASSSAAVRFDSSSSPPSSLTGGSSRRRRAEEIPMLLTSFIGVTPMRHLAIVLFVVDLVPSFAFAL